MKTLTIKDIGRDLNLSVSTVSRALQNHPDISEETKKLVVAYARDHHYRPNQLASSLRTQRNTTIGVVLPDITKWFFASVLSGIEDAAHEAGFNVLITRSNEEPESEKQCLHTLFASRVAGIIACPTRATTDYEPYVDIIDSGVPLVIVDRLAPLHCDQVVSDDYNGAFQAVEYLIQTGCKNIHVFSGSSSHVTLERQRGWREALQRWGLPADESAVHKCNSREEAISLASGLLGTTGAPDAVFCTSDQLANGVVYVAKMKNIAIPDELSVCGFSNNQITAHTDPMQTTVEQYAHAIGRKTVERLLLRIKASEEVPVPQTIVMKTDLIVRETTR